jgi:hypothetical protein
MKKWLSVGEGVREKRGGRECEYGVMDVEVREERRVGPQVCMKRR